MHQCGARAGAARIEIVRAAQFAAHRITMCTNEAGGKGLKMRADHRLIAFALLVVGFAGPVAAASRAAPADARQPFGVRDLVSLARISEIAVSPDGKRVAYTLRTTDMDANKGRTAIWLIETRMRNAAPV